MKNILLIFALVVITTTSFAQKKSSNSKRQYRDVTIEVNLFTGEEKVFAKKFGSPLEIEITDFRIDKLEINTDHQVFLRLINYNQLAYKVEWKFDNKEFQISSEARDQFLSVVSSLNNNEKPTDAEDIPADQINTQTVEALTNFKSTNTVGSASLAKALENKLKDKKNISTLKTLINDAVNNEIVHSVTSQGIVEELLINLEKQKDSLASISERLSSYLNDFNKTNAKLESSDDLKVHVIQSASNPDLEVAKNKTKELFKNYFDDADWKDTPDYFDNFRKKKLDDLKAVHKAYNDECDNLNKVEKEISDTYEAMKTLRKFLSASSNTSEELLLTLEQFGIFTAELKNITVGVGQKRTTLNSQFNKTISKDWKLLFNQMLHIYTKLLNSNSTFTIQLGQIEKDYAEIELTIFEANYVDGKLKFEENKPLHKSYKFRTKKGVKVSFSTGLGFSNYFQNQSSYVLKELPFEQVQSGDTTIIQPNDSSVIIEEKGNSFTPLLTSMMHVQFRSSNDFAWGFCLGIGVPLAGTKDVQFLLGSSLILGAEQRFIISFGASGGKVNKIGGGYNAGDSVPKGMEIPMLKDQYAIGVFLGVSYNIASSK